MTMLKKLMFWKTKQEPKVPDAFEQIRAQAPPYIIDKDYIKHNSDKCSFVINQEIVILEYKGAR